MSTDVSPRESNKKRSRKNNIHPSSIKTNNKNLFKEDILQTDDEMEDCTQDSSPTN